MKIKLYTLILLALALAGSGSAQEPKPLAERQRLQRVMMELDAAKTPENRFYALSDAAKESFLAGKTDDARKYAQELMSLLPQFQGNWNYGNAVQDANLVLGRIAVREGRIDDAKKYLLASADSKGSPQLDSFGPSFILARELAEKGERETVIAFLDSVARFWANPDDRTEPNSKSIASEHLKQLESWKEQLRAGKVPDHPKWR